MFEAHFKLGQTYSDLGRNQEATEAFKEAIRLKPDLAAAHSELGAAYLSLAREQEGAETFKEAIRLKPDYAPAHYNLGNLLSFVR